ncbi:hypothetical protein B7Y94_01590 [Candidatus Saccharibacteria bacterium 32-49-12]|nr:MAG: hypothetical protein B7Y94_01590 [Candidatus Saccharibacteria bacterium 32-49-12]
MEYNNLIWADGRFGQTPDSSLKIYQALPDDVKNHLDRIYDIDPDTADEMRHALTNGKEMIEVGVMRQAMIDFLNEHDERAIA